MRSEAFGVPVSTWFDLEVKRTVSSKDLVLLPQHHLLLPALFQPKFHFFPLTKQRMRQSRKERFLLGICFHRNTEIRRDRSLSAPPVPPVPAPELEACSQPS